MLRDSLLLGEFNLSVKTYGTDEPSLDIVRLHTFKPAELIFVYVKDNPNTFFFSIY